MANKRLAIQKNFSGALKLEDRTPKYALKIRDLPDKIKSQNNEHAIKLKSDLLKITMYLYFKKYDKAQIKLTKLCEKLHCQTQNLSSSKNIAIHDLKNTMFIVMGYIRLKRYEQAFAKLAQICKNFYQNLDNIESNVLEYSLKELINSQKNFIMDHNINFTYKFLIKKNLRIDQLDFCALIGNLLQNALESCEKISKNDDKFIILKVVQKNNRLSVIVENSMSDKVNASLKSDKKNKAQHGLGLKSVEIITKKYKGCTYIYQTNGIFFVRIILRV